MKAWGSTSSAVAGVSGPRVPRSPSTTWAPPAEPPARAAATPAPPARPPAPEPDPLADVPWAPAETSAVPDEVAVARQARAARRAFDRGRTLAEIGAELGLSPMEVHALIRRPTRGASP